MAGTTAVATKSALKTAIGAEAISGVGVFYGAPGDRTMPELIYLGKATEVFQEPASFRSGRKRRDEEFTIELFVEVNSKATPELSETRAAAIVTIIEEMIADDPKVSNTTNLLWVMVRNIEFSTRETGDQPQTLATMEIVGKGRIL